MKTFTKKLRNQKTSNDISSEKNLQIISQNEAAM
jgi:hypothetical protein